jgi:hypothetical protein
MGTNYIKRNLINEIEKPTQRPVVIIFNKILEVRCPSIRYYKSVMLCKHKGLETFIQDLYQ